MAEANLYTKLLEYVFKRNYRKGARHVPFRREQLIEAAEKLGIKLPKNIGDVIYSFRYRTRLPKSIARLAPRGESWIILPAGKAQYAFVTTALATITPNPGLAEIKIPDATPGVISMYALDDEQALLAKLRYNRMLDIFTGLTCYSLQSHLRTQVEGIGQIETDELYIGVNRTGAHFVIPVQAKRGRDALSVVQVWQDWMMAKVKFPDLICRPIAAQFMAENLIALFEFEQADVLLRLREEKHYRLVDPQEFSGEDLERYRALVTSMENQRV
ncbi:MAG: endonuclease [Verrucomicrobiae bacterium]|nr:endonuclease [Verrucomicrobiae bacterium]